MTELLRVYSWSELDAAQRAGIMERPAVAANTQISTTVQEILSAVRQQGDAALRELTARLDGAELGDIRVTTHEFEAARAQLTATQLAAIRTAIANVSRFHEAQRLSPLRVETAPGVICERIVRPIPAVGLYVPAGTAPLPSTAIMLGVPARIAGCPTRLLCTPPRPDGQADPAVLVAANECGVTEVFKLGGAQAIGAMAYGTESVPKADKIFGPGNAWVTAAKKEVAADPDGAALDLPAGPSEVMVIADETADPRAVALDLLSQAEHGPDSHVLLLTQSASLAAAVNAEIQLALTELPRREIILKALMHSSAILTNDIAESVAIANLYAPEHLILIVQDARSWLDRIQNAGSIFLGPYTPEAVGDYCSGTNHVLPTYGYARAYSGLAVCDFEKRISVQELTADGLRYLQPVVSTLARMEGLDAHARAVEVRVEALNEQISKDG